MNSKRKPNGNVMEADPAQTAGPWGNKGAFGQAFNDTAFYPNCGQLTKIELRWSKHINYLRCTWNNGERSRGHGTYNSKHDSVTILLGDGEYINRVSGVFDNTAIVRVTFVTSSGTSLGPFGDKSGSGTKFDKPLGGNVLQFFIGYEGALHLKGLGFGFSDSRLMECSLYGGTGGDFFDDSVQNDGHPEKITMISVSHTPGGRVNGIATTFGYGEVISHGGFPSGKDTVSRFPLRPGQYLIGVSGRYSDEGNESSITMLRFHTNGMDSEPYGGHDGGVPFSIEKPGMFINALYGRANGTLYALGGNFENYCDSNLTHATLKTIAYDTAEPQLLPQESMIILYEQKLTNADATKTQKFGSTLTMDIPTYFEKVQIVDALASTGYNFAPSFHPKREIKILKNGGKTQVGQWFEESLTHASPVDTEHEMKIPYDVELPPKSMTTLTFQGSFVNYCWKFTVEADAEYSGRDPGIQCAKLKGNLNGSVLNGDVKVITGPIMPLDG